MIAHEDWCMWRRLEEKLIYMPKVNLSFTEQFSGNNTDEAVEGYIQSDLRTRCLALLSALDSINSNDS